MYNAYRKSYSRLPFSKWPSVFFSCNEIDSKTLSNHDLEKRWESNSVPTNVNVRLFQSFANLKIRIQKNDRWIERSTNKSDSWESWRWSSPRENNASSRKIVDRKQSRSTFFLSLWKFILSSMSSTFPLDFRKRRYNKAWPYFKDSYNFSRWSRSIKRWFCAARRRHSSLLERETNARKKGIGLHREPPRTFLNLIIDLSYGNEQITYWLWKGQYLTRLKRKIYAIVATDGLLCPRSCSR